MPDDDVKHPLIPPVAQPGSPDDESNSDPQGKEDPQEARGGIDAAPRPYSPRVDGKDEGK